VIQDKIIENLISQHNEEVSKFSSPFIRMGAFLQYALAEADQINRKPCTFLTQVQAHILDQLVINLPQIS